MPPRKTIITSYLTRKNYSDNIFDNFSKYDRRSYFQRILFMGKHKYNKPNIIKANMIECIRKINENSSGEIITGVCLYYTMYSLYMIEGSEDVIGMFMEHLIKIQKDLFETCYLLIIINNIRKVLFPKFVFKTGDPPIILEKLVFDDDDNDGASLTEQSTLIDRFLYFCREVSMQVKNEKENEDNEFMSGEYNRILISTQRIEFVLANIKLYPLEHYLTSFRKVPILEDFDEMVWPIQYDYTPTNVFIRDKYDVNLTFPDK